jgi:hypothetical protein
MKGHGNEKKGKKTSPTCQGASNFFKCTLKSSHKAPKMKILKTFHCLKFSKAFENVVPH